MKLPRTCMHAPHFASNDSKFELAQHTSLAVACASPSVAHSTHGSRAQPRCVHCGVDKTPDCFADCMHGHKQTCPVCHVLHIHRMLARQRAEAERNGASSIDDDPLSADSYGPYFAAAAARRARLAALAGAAHIDGSGLWHAPSLELVVKEGVLVLQPDESDTRGLTCVGLACTSSKLSGFEQQETGTAGDKGAHETAVSAEPQPESGQQAEGQMPQQPQDGRGTGAVLHEASSPSRTGDGTSASTGGPAAEQPTLNTAQTNSSGADNCKEQSDKGQS